MVSANHWLGYIKTYRLSWYLTAVSANHASSNSAQTGFIKTRGISDNIRTLDGVIKYTANKKVPGLLLFFDFEKAFDFLEWSFIDKTLQHFGFGPSLSSWVRLFYCNVN